MLDTRSFLDLLAAQPDAALAFAHDDFGVPEGFHLTEVKALAVEGMDCGGQADQWYETHFQLWHPGTPGGERLNAGKFLRIVDRVRSAVPLRAAAGARVEWGGAGRPAVAYLVRGAAHADGTLTVHLYDPQVNCKANARQPGRCGPQPATEQPARLQPLGMVVAAGESCAPGSGCC